MAVACTLLPRLHIQRMLTNADLKGVAEVLGIEKFSNERNLAEQIEEKYKVIEE